MKINKHRQPAAILLVVAMVAAAGYAHEKEIIFPEIAALVFGAWVMKESPWQGKDRHLWLSPSLAALTGVVLQRLIPALPYISITAAFILVALQMKLMRSSVLPSLSAALLPILLHCDSWYYPLYVCILTGIIVVGRNAFDHFSGEANTFDTVAPESGNLTHKEHFEELLHWGKLLAAVSIVAAFAITYHWMFVIAPPLIVAFVELSKPNGTMRQKSGPIFVLLVLAAFSGVFWLYVGNHLLHWPVWISTALIISSVYLFFHMLRLSFPPAAAIALLPIIIPAKRLLSYPGHVAIGSAAFILLSLSWFKQPALQQK
jgi:hypothetical protein